MKFHFNTLLNAFHQKDKSNLRNFIRISKAQIISGSGLKIHELKKSIQSRMRSTWVCIM